MEEPAPFPRASLFIASRLASTVQRFRQRLHEKVRQKKKSSNPFGNSYYRGIRLRAVSDLERSALPRQRLSVSEEPKSAVEHHDHGRWINGLLYDLNRHTTASAFSLTGVAADDHLLLSHSQDNLIETLAQHATVRQAAYMFDSSTFLIGKLEVLQSDKMKKWAEADADCKRLKEERYIANLLHLLRRLQYVLFQVLVHRSITRLDELALHWHTYWQQRKKVGEDWFTEWPSGQRPLSTTWPWNIRPSLLVLWGVCWMFYPPEQDNRENPRSPAAQQLVDGSLNWTLDNVSGEDLEQARRVELAIGTATSASMPAANHTQAAALTMGENLYAASRPLSARAAPPHPPASPQQAQSYQGDSQLGLSPGASFWRPIPGESRSTGANDAVLGISHASLNEPLLVQGWGSTSPLFPSSLYSQPTSAYASLPGSRDSGRWLITSGGGDTLTSDAGNQVPSNVWSGYHQQGSPSPYAVRHTDVPRFEVSPVEGRPYTPTVDPIPTQPYPQHTYGDNQDMGIIDDYPSPHSEPGRRPSITTPTSMPGSVATDHVTPSGSEGSKGVQISINRGEPPRDDLNRIYCAHAACAKDPAVFRRPCEWNKHMDKHDRPYKCHEPGCDKVQGFTYSGGLLRHQREVHKKNQPAAREWYCRVPNCNRSNSQPFTRLENLREHQRRRHVAEGALTSPGGQSAIATPATPATPAGAPARSHKRKRTTSMDFHGELQSRDEQSDMDADSEPVKRLKKTILLKDKRISELEGEIARLREQESNLKALLGT